MNLIKEIIKGVFIGIANIIPGVSGGTMAVSMGIYDKIISAITNLFKDFKNSVKCLFPYIIGGIAGIIGLSFMIEYLFGHFPLQTSMAFIGLILGGLPILFQRIKGKRIGLSNGIIFLLFFALIIVLQLLGGNDGNQREITISFVEIIKLFAIGVVASATMVIPGVSGSMILMILGYYEPIIAIINSFIKAVIRLDFPVILNGIYILLPFGIGVLIGIFAIAKLIEILLTRFEVLTYCAILGLVVASPVAILMNTNILKIGFLVIVSSIITFAIGFFIAYLLGRENKNR